MGKRWKSLGELYELCDNSSYKRSSYAEFTVLWVRSEWLELAVAIRWDPVLYRPLFVDGWTWAQRTTGRHESSRNMAKTRNVCVALVCPAERRSHGTPVNGLPLRTDTTKTVCSAKAGHKKIEANARKCVTAGTSSLSISWLLSLWNTQIIEPTTAWATVSLIMHWRVIVL